MGKKIDAFVLTLLFAAGYYLYFLHATKNNALAICAALLCCWVTVKSLKRIAARIRSSKSVQKRNCRKASAGIIMRLACADSAKASEQMERIIEQSYHESCSVVLVQCHPTANLSHQAVFDSWKEHKGKEKLVVCATCKCPDEVRMMATGLQKPRIAVLDSYALQRILAQSPVDIDDAQPAENKKQIKWPAICMQLINRRNAPRCLLCGFSCLLLYLLSGNAFYLAGAMGVILIALLSFRQRTKPLKLF